MGTDKLGDFTELASDYARYRPGYSSTVLEAIVALLPQPARELDAVDIGAGTGIWTRQLADQGLRTVTAVEPNDAMRHFGQTGNQGRPITWLAGSAETTGLPDACCDLVTMASSFHWANFEQACAEFYRLLRPGGLFVALWNTRIVTQSALLERIEQRIRELEPNLKRVSSGTSEFTSTLSERLAAHDAWREVRYLEGTHVEHQSPERYLGIWRSVNDIRVQLGPEKFQRFLDFVEHEVAAIEYVEASYRTRAWLAWRS
ncbi:MAG: class I SAM-dependent methyltransferase [Vulcanimicrobiota bacterium]